MEAVPLRRTSVLPQKDNNNDDLSSSKSVGWSSRGGREHWDEGKMTLFGRATRMMKRTGKGASSEDSGGTMLSSKKSVTELSKQSWFGCLKGFQRLERNFLASLWQLEAFYTNEFIFDDLSLLSMEGAHIVTLNVRQLTQFHEELLQTINLVCSGDLPVQDPIGEMVDTYMDALPLYYAYADGWRASERTLTQLLEIERIKNAALAAGLDHLRLSPFEHVKKIYSWIRLEEDVVPGFEMLFVFFFFRPFFLPHPLSQRKK